MTILGSDRCIALSMIRDPEGLESCPNTKITFVFTSNITE
jgi:hypothetical protein